MNFLNKILQTVNKNLFYLIVFLIPTQLAYHFWPNYSFVYGLRVDYLSVALYLTDILIFIYLVFVFINNKKKIIFSKINILRLFIFILFVLLNIVYSKQKEISIFKWIKIFEFIIFSFAVSKDKFLVKSKIFKTFCYSLIFFGIIGLSQVVKDSTLGGIFYYLGERNFSSVTPGISLFNIFNFSLLKPYSTFSHPNSLAGYVLLVYIFLLSWKTDNNKDKLLKYLTFTVTFCLFLFSYSKATLISLFIISLISILKKSISLEKIKLLTYLGIFISLLSPIFSAILLKYRNIFPDNITERLLLSKTSGQMLVINPAFGVGLNNFITSIPSLNAFRFPFWLLQPVHNIFLLFTVETGLIGMGILFIYIYKYLTYLVNNGKRNFIYIYLAVFITGLFDHYWFTLQQNMILIFLFLGLSKNKQIK